MANSVSNNVLKIDTAGAAITEVTFPIKVIAIDYIASADTWSTVITDIDSGQTLFRCASDIANQRSFFKYYGGVQVRSLWPETLTDMAEVLVYFTGPGK
jgi:hypothetical protein